MSQSQISEESPGQCRDGHLNKYNRADQRDGNYFLNIVETKEMNNKLLENRKTSVYKWQFNMEPKSKDREDTINRADSSIGIA